VSYTIHYRYGPADGRARRYLLVVSHQRSFSSLLCHILGSHREIDGYAETHLTYTGRIDLRQLESKVSEMTEGPISGRYVLDKILDSEQYLSPDVLARPELSMLFLVRNALDTMKSILNMNLTMHRTPRLSNPQGVLDYYVLRLQQIEDYSDQRRGDTVFVESEQLIGNTDRVLDRLTQWLDLSEPLRSSYRTFKFTGVEGYGDPSSNIKVGRVLRAPAERHRQNVAMTIPPEMLGTGEAAHARCCAALRRWSLLA
jgi:hypothetical protein